MAATVSEEYQKVFAFRARDFFQDALLRFSIDYAREDAILDRVQDDGTVGTGGRLLIQSRTCVWVWYQSYACAIPSSDYARENVSYRYNPDWS